MRSKTSAFALSFAVFLGLAASPTLAPVADAQAARASGRIAGHVDASLVKNLADAVVYVQSAAGPFAPPSQPVELGQRDTAFIPHVLPILVGTKIHFPNQDRVRHSVFSASKAKPFNLGIYLPGESRDVLFDVEGVVTLLCSIHEEMSAYVLVLQNPFFAKVAADGTYALSGVPDGAYSVALWSEGKPLVLRKVTVRGGGAAEAVFD